MNRPYSFFFFLITCVFSQPAFSQYILNGAAQQNSCNCYTLTPATTFQTGSVWNSNKIDLTNSFDFWFNVNLGCLDGGGADGMVFILQPISTSIGATGGGMGFGGVSPSIGIPLDTYQNTDLNDPAYDHISIQANGNINHSSDLAGPVAISSNSDNIEDCNWHTLRISWDASSKIIRAFFDGILRVEKQIDLITTIFNNDPNVYWGFTAATGGSVNVQQFCTALNPDFSSNFSSDAACINSAFQFTNQSESFAPISNYNWNFGNGNSSTLPVPPAQTYAAAGTYTVSLQIKGLDGCENTIAKTITIGSDPFADLEVFDTCFKNSPRLNYSQNNFGVTYQWALDGTTIPTNGAPDLSALPAGNHSLQLTVTSLFGCGIPDTDDAQFFIHPLPQVAINVAQLCKDVIFTGSQIDNATTISQWNWLFGDNTFSQLQNPFHQYVQSGQYEAKLWAKSTDGCTSDTAIRLIHILEGALAFAGNDTVVIKYYPFQLQGTGNGSFQWTPVVGLSNPFIANPVVTLANDQDFILTVTSPEGCVSKDTLRIKVFNGPAIYIPSAFTPNGDGLNDVLRPVYAGINSLEVFSIFNRWGQLVFSTSDRSKGWDGKTTQKDFGSGTYVWVIKARNNLDQSLILKGTVTIIK